MAQAIGEAGAWYKRNALGIRISSSRQSSIRLRRLWSAIFALEHLTLRAAARLRARADLRGTKYLTSVDVGQPARLPIINVRYHCPAHQRVKFDRLERVSHPVIQSAIEARARLSWLTPFERVMALAIR